MLSTLLRKPVRIDLSQTPLPAKPSNGSLSREQLVDRIIALNPSASVDFLAQFEDHALGDYLEHLNRASRPRGREATWVRPSRTPWACSAAACA